MSVLRHLAAIVVCCDIAMVVVTNVRVRQRLDVIAYCQHQLVCNETFAHKVESNGIRHLLDNDPCFLECVGFCKHLSAAQRIGLRSIGFHIVHRDRFPSPGMVDKEFRIHTKEFVEQSLTLYGTESHIAHGVHTILSKFLCYAFAHTPELGDWGIVPQLFPVTHLIEFRNAHTVLVSRSLLCHDVHGYLAEVKVCADAGSSRYPGILQDITYHGHGKFMCRHPVCVKVSRHVHKDLVDGINVNILWSDVFQVYLIDTCAVFNVFGHARRGSNVVNFPIFVNFEFLVLPRLSRQATERALVPSLIVNFTQPLHNLKQTCPSSNAVGFEGRGNGQTDSLLCPAHVCHNKIGGERIETTFYAFHGSEERFQVDGYICTVVLGHNTIDC